MTDHDHLLVHLVNARHDSDDVLKLIQEYIEETGDAVDLIHDLCFTVLQLTQVIHKIGHMDPKTERMLDTMVAGGPAAMNAQISEAVSPDELLSEEYTRHIFDQFTDGTEPADRVWSITSLPNGQTAMTLEGSGFPRRVFVAVGATDEQIDQLRTRMVQYEESIR